MPVLVKLFETHRKDPLVAVAILKTWEKMGPAAADAQPLLVAILESPDRHPEPVRRAAFEAYQAIKKK